MFVLNEPMNWLSASSIYIKITILITPSRIWIVVLLLLHSFVDIIRFLVIRWTINFLSVHSASLLNESLSINPFLYYKAFLENKPPHMFITLSDTCISLIIDSKEIRDPVKVTLVTIGFLMLFLLLLLFLKYLRLRFFLGLFYYLLK